MPCLICNKHGPTTFVASTCADLFDDFHSGKRLREHRKISVVFDPPIDGYPVWFSVLFCTECLATIGLGPDQDEVTEKDLESTLAEHKERFCRTRGICSRCFADHLATYGGS